MAQSRLWERLQVFFTALKYLPASASKFHHSILTPRVSATPAPAPFAMSKACSRVQALEQALETANAAVLDERACRMKWERRALVAKAEQNAQRDELTYSENRVKALEKRLARAYARAEDDRSMRRVAEEQKQVAIERLVEGVDKVMVVQLEKERSALREKLNHVSAEFCEERHQLQKKIATLGTEMMEFRAEAQRERERFVTQLAERTKNFASLEMDLKDARETYVTAAKTLDTQQRNTNGKVLEKRMSMPSNLGKVRAESMDRMKLEHYVHECRRLARENEKMKIGCVPSDKPCGTNKRGERWSTIRAMNETAKAREDGAGMRLRRAFSERGARHDSFNKQLAPLKTERDGSERLSSSSLSSECDSGSVSKKTEELDLTVEGESDEAEQLRRQVVGLVKSAARKEQEASQIRGEMVVIHSKMRQMATLSLPKGAEELVGNDEDMKRLAQLRMAAKSKDGKEQMGMLQRNTQPKRRSKLPENKRVMRPWLRK